MLIMHRVAYTLQKGHIPEGWKVRRECKNPRCVRDTHLYLCRRIGSQHHKAKQTEVTALRLVADRRKGMLLRELCNKYGVSMSVASQTANGKLWKHLKEIVGDELHANPTRI